MNLPRPPRNPASAIPVWLLIVFLVDIFFHFLSFLTNLPHFGEPPTGKPHLRVFFGI